MNTNKAGRLNAIMLRPAWAAPDGLTYSIYILDSKEEKFSKIQRYAGNKFNNLPIYLHATLTQQCVFNIQPFGNLSLTTLCYAPITQ